MNTPDSFFADCPPPDLGFTPPRHRPLGEETGAAALASLLTSLALVIATLAVIVAMSSSSPQPPQGPVRADWSTTQRG